MVTKLETQGKQIFQWGEKFVDIATLEKAVYEAVLSLGRNIMRQCIEEADRTLGSGTVGCTGTRATGPPRSKQ